MKLIFATEANKLHQEQWVNIYELTLTGGAKLYGSCQGKDLEKPSEYGLKLIHERKVIFGEGLK